MYMGDSMTSSRRSITSPLAWLFLAWLAAAPPLLASEAERRIPAETEPFLGAGAGAPLLGLLTLPSGWAGPRPVAVFVADRDGPGQRTALYADRLLENGWAVIELFAGLEDLDHVPQPLQAALASVVADARLAPGQRLLVGLGLGARTALAAWAAGLPVQRLALLYPGCDAALAETARAATPSRLAGSVLLLHGDADTANAPSGCADLAAALPGGIAAEHRVLPGASYAWDGFFMVRPGGLAKLPHPADAGRRIAVRPDLTTTLIAADRLLGFAMGGE